VLESELLSSSAREAELTVVVLLFLGGVNLFVVVFFGSVFLVVLLLESEALSSSELTVVLLVFLGSFLVVLLMAPLILESSELDTVELGLELDTVVLLPAFLVGSFIDGLFVAPKLFGFEVGLD